MSDRVYKDDGVTYIKVVGFPGHERMWVARTSGDELDGEGTLANDPVCSDMKHGDAVRYTGGTEETAPYHLPDDTDQEARDATG